jgi:hypothetical protein
MTEPMDVYSDQTQIGTSPYGLTLFLFESSSTPNATTPPRQVGTVRMSLEHAKVLTIMLRKSLKLHEDSQHSPIILHPNAVQGAGISVEEDW